MRKTKIKKMRKETEELKDKARKMASRLDKMTKESQERIKKNEKREKTTKFVNHCQKVPDLILDLQENDTRSVTECSLAAVKRFVVNKSCFKPNDRPIPKQTCSHTIQF